MGPQTVLRFRYAVVLSVCDSVSHEQQVNSTRETPGAPFRMRHSVSFRSRIVWHLGSVPVLLTFSQISHSFRRNDVRAPGGNGLVVAVAVVNGAHQRPRIVVAVVVVVMPSQCVNCNQRAMPAA